MESDSGYSYLMLLLGWLIYFSFGLINTAIAPLVFPIMSDLSLTYTQMGFITGAWQLLYIFSAQPLGIVIDRLGVYRSLLLGAVVVSSSALLRCFVTGFVDLFASVALFGLGGTLISIGTPKLISIWFRGRSRGTALGINASGSVMGSAAALFFTNSIVLPVAGGWRNVFLCLHLASAGQADSTGRRRPRRNIGRGAEADIGSRASQAPRHLADSEHRSSLLPYRAWPPELAA